MRATKLIRSLRGLSYTERLQKLKLPTLKYRRLRDDMIELYKMVTGKYNEDSCIKFNFVSREDGEVNQARGNKFKIFQEHVHYNLRKYYFSNRVIQIWNSLHDSVVESNSINSFKNNLDKFWQNEDVKINWKANLTGAGSRSLSLTQFIYVFS